LHLASGRLGIYKAIWLEVVCLLLKHGADVEAKDDEGRTAFYFASSRGLHDIAKLLSEHGTK
jgi:ankyrin repeat protein